MPPEFDFAEIDVSGGLTARSRAVAEELPIAVEFAGIGYAVLMATACDLEDLAYGFAWSERLIDDPGQIEYVAVHHTEGGAIIRIGLAGEVLPRIHDRVRYRTSESSCGLCGIENLEQAMRPLPRLADSPPVEERSIFTALGALRDHQPLNRETGGVHAAALVGADGTIRLAREDIGRHNGFDKLVGAMLRQGLQWEDGFALLSSRCSYELVEKAVLSRCPALVTISVPTTLALTRAREANLRLYVLARSDSVLRVPLH